MAKKRTIKARWEEMVKIAPVHLTAWELEHARLMFYCGANAVFHMTDGLAQRFNDDECRTIWEQWREELVNDGPEGTHAKGEAENLLDKLTGGKNADA
jgi:hypothetical protein